VENVSQISDRSLDKVQSLAIKKCIFKQTTAVCKSYNLTEAKQTVLKSRGIHVLESLAYFYLIRIVQPIKWIPKHGACFLIDKLQKVNCLRVKMSFKWADCVNRLISAINFKEMYKTHSGKVPNGSREVEFCCLAFSLHILTCTFWNHREIQFEPQEHWSTVSIDVEWANDLNKLQQKFPMAVF